MNCSATNSPAKRITVFVAIAAILGWCLLPHSQSVKLLADDTQSPDHESFLWGPGSAALAVMYLTGSLQVEDLPMVVYDDGGGQAIKPVSEYWLAESAADILLARGIVPLIGNRSGTDLRAPRLQTASATPAGL